MHTKPAAANREACDPVAGNSHDTDFAAIRDSETWPVSSSWVAGRAATKTPAWTCNHGRGDSLLEPICGG
eukprot:5971363-Alexandrium_andersonii.AAC.1